jgi:hypothetical protein
MKEIQVLFTGEIISKMGWGHFKNILKNHYSRNAWIYMTAA